MDHQILIANMRAAHALEVVEVRNAIDRDAEELKRLNAELDELVKVTGAKLADTSDLLLLKLGQAALAELQTRERNAYRIRNRAMVAVWAIDERHHAVEQDKCSCGSPLNRCNEYGSLTFFREEFEQWERRQIALMRADKEHGLPENHPEARKWNGGYWRGTRSTEPNQAHRRAG